jgi:2-polyprenyl-6-hydroxyphenyl methylase/3-demethylubiquinone-9 3-methyltransferase
VTPDELAGHLAASGLGGIVSEGMVFDPLSDTWSLSADTDVNYLVAAAKPA